MVSMRAGTQTGPSLGGARAGPRLRGQKAKRASGLRR